MYAYCGGNPINYVDPSGHFVVAIPLVEYYFISAVVSIVVTKEAIDVVSAKRHKTKEYNTDPYGRNNQKKQGRENKNKNRTKENYKPKNNKRNNMPAKPKKHTPGRGHNKYKGRK